MGGSLGALSFSSGWLLALILALPALWWLLRITPPPPRRLDFPAVRLLFGLETAQQTARSAPLWLIFLRLLLVTALIVAASGPSWRRNPAHSDGPWLILVDNGWATGKDWTQRKQLLQHLIRQADHDGQAVSILATAPPEDGGAVALAGPLAASDALALAQALRPEPWRNDRTAASHALSTLPHGRAMRVLWISDGFDESGAADLAARLQTYGQLELFLPAAEERAQMLLAPSTGPASETVLHLTRPAGGDAAVSRVRALDEQGRSLALVDIAWSDQAHSATQTVSWPSELKNRMTRLIIDGEDHAAATWLLDGRWSPHAVGLVDEGADDRIPLLDDLFYGERAMAGFAEVRRGRIATLLQRPLSLMILPDRGAISDQDRAMLRRWVGAGGTLLRFAGPDLAGNPDDLLPVRLRASERLLGGALSWAQPMSVAPMPDSGPFAGLAVPSDVTVSAQILAEPELNLGQKTWARLVDGTPLVTGAPLGQGWLVLIHTTAWPGWSNLPLSGLFPEMLRRLLDRSNGVAMATNDRPLPPLFQLDGRGHLVTPDTAAESWPAGEVTLSLGPRHPPGFYGDGALRRAVNLAPTLTEPRPLAVPAGALALHLEPGRTDLDLRPWLFGLALLLLLIDLLLLSGLRRRASMATLIAFGLTMTAQAADDVAAALDTRLAYVVTGDPALDDVSRDGLAALSRQILRRTTAILSAPAAVDLERDSLSVYPMLYWPLSAGQRPLSEGAQTRLNDFMRHGGLLVIDSRDGGSMAPEKFRQITQGIDLPPLIEVGDQHVLAKSFYLLHDFPGRLDGAPLFAEQGGNAAHDFVSPVLIGGNDWAAAWASDRQGIALFPVVPGGEAQREMAFRFGINLVIYALTGSYKADQVHVPSILERMHR